MATRLRRERRKVEENADKRVKEAHNLSDTRVPKNPMEELDRRDQKKKNNLIVNRLDEIWTPKEKN